MSESQDGFDRMLHEVTVNQRTLEGMHRDLIELISLRPRLNNDDLTAAAKLIASELTTLKIKEREIRYMQDHPQSAARAEAN